MGISLLILALWYQTLYFLFLSTGGKKCLQFYATDGKKLTPTKTVCQTQGKKKPVL